MDALISGRAQDGDRAPSGAPCGQPMRQVEGLRARQRRGLGGGDTRRRAYDHGAPCGQGQAPRDVQGGVGRGTLAPALLWVVGRAGGQEAFAEAAALAHEARGVGGSAERAERATARRGTVAAARGQEAIARGTPGQAAWSAAPLAAPPATGVGAVDVEGGQRQRDDGGPARQVVTVAPLGPAWPHERASGRTPWAWGEASDGAGFAEAADCC